MSAQPDAVLGRPRAHFRVTDSTNLRARALAAAGAPHGTLVTAREQTAGRGRQGRAWVGTAGRALLLSVLVREFDDLLPLRAGLAVARIAGAGARIKWPNDVLLGGRKLAGILVEGRPQEGWAVIGIGLNVAVDPATLPSEVRAVAATLGRPPEALEPTLTALLEALAVELGAPAAVVAAELRRRDALLGRTVNWAGGGGEAAGIDDRGRLVVRMPGGSMQALDAGEVHLGSATGSAFAMEPIIVRRHGSRWAVQDGPDAMPTAEYDTLQAAESAARGQAAGREVIVHAGDDDGLGGGGGTGEGDGPEGADAGIDQRTGGGGSGDETPREPQAGL